MKLSAEGRKSLELREGSKNNAYRDSRGIWTIGVGHIGDVHPGMHLTSAQVDSLFSKDIEVFSNGVDALIKMPVTQNQFDALVSFAFNIGLHGFTGSSTLKALNHGDYSTAADDMLMWEKPPELKKRREGERRQFLTPDTGAAPVASSNSVEKKMDVLAGIKNVFGNVVSTLEAAAPAVENNAIPQVTTDSVGSPSDIMAAVSDIKQIISDIEGKKYTAVPEDIFKLLTLLFGTLDKFGINVPGASIAMKVLSGIATVI